MNWAAIGVRRRAVVQRTADNAKTSDIPYWIETGELWGPDRRPPEDAPEVHIAREQIRKDGRLIVENVTRAIEQWRDQQ